MVPFDARGDASPKMRSVKAGVCARSLTRAAMGVFTILVGICAFGAAGAQPVGSSSSDSVPTILGNITQTKPDQTASDVSLLTRNRNLEELGQELSRIYLTLYNAKRLSVRFVMKENDTIEGVLRRNGLFYGKFLPPDLDSMLCDMNVFACDRDRSAPAVPSDNEVTGVSGTLPSPTKWRLEDPALSLLLPDVVLTKDIQWRPYDLQAAADLKTVVIDELGGCQEYDDACRRLISFYNPNLGRKNQQNKGEKLVLPVLAIKVSANVANVSEVQSAVGGGLLINNAMQLQKVITPTGRDSFKVIVNETNDRLSASVKETAPDQVIKRLQNNLIPKISIKAFDVPVLAGAAMFPMDIAKARSDLGGLLTWPPQLSAYPYPPDFTGGVEIGVLDSRVDDQHCGLDYSRVHVNNKVPFTASEPRADCALSVDGREEVDHGTHVVGIIGAMISNGGSRTLMGLNPYAQISTLEIDFVNPSSEQIAADLKLTVEQRLLKVVNMSFGYVMTAQNPDLQLNDALEGPIAALSNATLFVAAAGNAGINKSYLCDVRPACFDLPNVIAVAAIDRSATAPGFLDRDQKRHSNYGSRIHTAAIGDNVLSTLSNGRLGLMSGTSQAAPQVTALASLMFAKYPGVLPVEVKNRLIYCSDMFETLSDKIFSGGRINAECSLDGSMGRITPRVGGTTKGRLDLSDTLSMNDVDGNDVRVPVQTLRAIRYNPWSDAYTVFYKAKNSPESNLLRLSDLRFKEPEKTIRFYQVTGGPKSIPVGQIVQYVSPMR